MTSSAHVKPTIRDVAHASGVSAPTVSRVLRGNATNDPQTRERVLDAVRALGYRPPSAKPSLPQHSSHTLGLFNISGFTEMSYYRFVLDGLLRAAGTMRQNLVLFGDYEWKEDPHRSIRFFLDGRCDGLFYLQIGREEPLLDALGSRGLPLVLIGEQDPRVPWVDLDHEDAVRQGLAHLIGLGHRQITFFGGEYEGEPMIPLRRRAYEMIMTEHGLSLSIVERPFAAAGIQTPDQFTTGWLSEIWNRPADRRPTAIFCWNDEQAAALLVAMARRGLRAPRDLSVIGVDDDDKHAPRHRLTTIRQPHTEIGVRALTLLVDLIEQRLPAEFNISLPGELIVRKTTGPPPSRD